MIPLFNKSKYNGMDVEKLYVVTVWPLPTKSCRRYYTTLRPSSPSPIPLWRVPPSASLISLMSLSVSLSSSSRFLFFLQYTSKFQRYFYNASAVAHNFIPKCTIFWPELPNWAVFPFIHNHAFINGQLLVTTYSTLETSSNFIKHPPNFVQFVICRVLFVHSTRRCICHMQTTSDLLKSILGHDLRYH